MRGFKARLAVALCLVIGLGWMLRSEGVVRESAETFRTYVKNTDYDVAGWAKKVLHSSLTASSPVSAPALRLPCAFQRIVRHFGWSYNTKTGKQDFYPGIVLQVKPKTAVYPMIKGKVVKIATQEGYYLLVIQHGSGLISVMRGLAQVSVREGQQVQAETVLGRASDFVSVELRSKEGPINIENMLKPGAVL